MDVQGSVRDSAYQLGPNRRAMVSLGPLKPRNYCTYSCPFCYVHGPFPRYEPTAGVDEITGWLAQRRERFDIVYVSGDTDSFATPRASEALELLDRLLSLDCDVLFTTRYLFADHERDVLASIAQRFREAGRMLVGCVSVSQLHQPRLEPRPVAPPEARLAQLAWMRNAGIVTVLTIRPFIPGVPAAEYAEIAERGAAAGDVVLGGDWYVDPEKVILRQTERALGVVISDAPSSRPLDFTSDKTAWHIYEHPAAEAAVREVCSARGKPFFMRSDPAIAHLRDRRS